MFKEQRAVVVHCSFTLEEDCHFQLSSKATISDHDSQHKSQMLYMEGIGVTSNSHFSVKGQVMQFTLYFEPLATDCKVFTIHITMQDQQYLAAVDVPRRLNDVYRVELEVAPF
ncbi:MAG: hypothetical protein NTW16_00920 [Bacteroidetes bacterium]|nr:hypothetical protein [Bacteroidota bacterium]